MTLESGHLCKKIHYVNAARFEHRSRKTWRSICAKFFVEIARSAGYRRYKNPYFIVFFAITTMRAKFSCTSYVRANNDDCRHANASLPVATHWRTRFVKR